MAVSEEWTIPQLKEHFDALRAADKEAITTALTAAEKAVAAAMAASEKAILKAETAADKRAEASNEIRAAMVDQQKNFASKDETERRLKMLEENMATDRGKSAGIGQLAGMLALIIAAVAAIVGVIFLIRGHA